MYPRIVKALRHVLWEAISFWIIAKLCRLVEKKFRTVIDQFTVAFTTENSGSTNGVTCFLTFVAMTDNGTQCTTLRRTGQLITGIDFRESRLFWQRGTNSAQNRSGFLLLTFICFIGQVNELEYTKSLSLKGWLEATVDVAAYVSQ